MKRIYHPWTAWECVRAGMYETIAPTGITDAREQYASFLRDTPRFEAALRRVVAEWPISCEHFLSNEHINRIAWLGQASMCIATGIPACFRGGFHLLTEAEQAIANHTADQCLRMWLVKRGAAVDMARWSLATEPERESGAVPMDLGISGGRIARVAEYVRAWRECGYPDDLPDEVPNGIMRELLAPSYKAICVAILKNDPSMQSLGFTPRKSRWYDAIKRVEVASREKPPEAQLSLF